MLYSANYFLKNTKRDIVVILNDISFNFYQSTGNFLIIIVYIYVLNYRRYI